MAIVPSTTATVPMMVWPVTCSLPRRNISEIVKQNAGEETRAQRVKHMPPAVTQRRSFRFPGDQHNPRNDQQSSGQYRLARLLMHNRDGNRRAPKRITVTQRLAARGADSLQADESE